MDGQPSLAEVINGCDDFGIGPRQLILVVYLQCAGPKPVEEIPEVNAACFEIAAREEPGRLMHL